jgi:hypothetical protein
VKAFASFNPKLWPYEILLASVTETLILSAQLGKFCQLGQPSWGKFAETTLGTEKHVVQLRN